MPRLRVDFIACDGRGVCAEILPDLIRLDDWGYPIVADCEVPRNLLPDAAEAVLICPMLALRLDHARKGDDYVAEPHPERASPHRGDPATAPPAVRMVFSALCRRCVLARLRWA